MTKNRNPNRAGAILAKAFSGAYDPQFETDAKGRKVRKPVADAPVELEDVRFALLNNRVVEEDDMLEAVGKGVLRYLVDNKMLVPSQTVSGLLWVTTKAKERYNLRPVVGGFMKVA
jgi:hypothetical protein